MREKLQRRSTAQAKAEQPAGPSKTADRINWSTHEGHIIASFEGKEVDYLAWTPAQAREVIAVIERSLAMIEAGK